MMKTHKEFICIEQTTPVSRTCSEKHLGGFTFSRKAEMMMLEIRELYPKWFENNLYLIHSSWNFWPDLWKIFSSPYYVPKRRNCPPMLFQMPMTC
jgi:hypothetical protein